jgi:DNA-binding transcriptional LysR family regulator
MELRHLRYFTAVVQWKGYRGASRHLYIAQPSISEAVSDLESELGIKLFSRDGRVARLTSEGQVFYEEAIKTLAQAERSIATAQRAAKGEIVRLGIGFVGFATYPFLSDLLRTYKARHPGVALRLEENVPSGQDTAFDRGEIDIGFTRPPSADRSSSYESRLIFREPFGRGSSPSPQSNCEAHPHRGSCKRALRNLSARQLSGGLRHDRPRL